MSGSYRDLKVWQKAMELVYRVFEATQSFPKHELYGLVSQLRRAAVSVPSNIAEGKGRSGDPEMILFLCHARGSLHEVETQVLISKHLTYLDEVQSHELLARAGEVARMLNGLMTALTATA